MGDRSWRHRGKALVVGLGERKHFLDTGLVAPTGGQHRYYCPKVGEHRMAKSLADRQKAAYGSLELKRVERS